MVGIDGTFLRSAVGRRIFVLFLLATTLPIALMAVVTYQGVSSLLNRQAAVELASYSKSYGLEVFSRLSAAQAMLERFGAGSEGAAAIHESPFRFLAVVGTDGVPASTPGEPAVPAQVLADPSMRAALEAALHGGESLLVIPGATTADALLAMVVSHHVNGRPPSRILALLEPSYLFGERENLAAQTDLCVTTADRIALYCSDPRLFKLAQRIPSRNAGVTQAVEAAAEPMDHGAWTLYPSTNLKFVPWTIMSIRAVDKGALADRGIGRTYIEIALACLVLVSLLSLIQIRRILVPLERLTDATRRIAASDFSRPIQIDRQDEFGRLATSFNDMARTLDNQIGALKTLSSIDREILSRLDVDRIIERVLQRLQILAPGCVAAIARIPAGSAVAPDMPMWRWRSAAMEKLRYSPGQAERSQLSALEPVTTLERGDRHRWDLARAVLDDGAGCGVLLSVRTRGGACTLIALGLTEARFPEQPALEQIRELGNRVGVAFDAADWEKKLLDEARNDSLTGLPNRLRIHEIIEEKLAAAPFEILFIDLDRFKGVNDGLGHDAGDALLIQAAQRIRQSVLTQDIVARLGGDEFIVLTTDVATDGRIGALARSIIAALSAPYRIGPAEVHVSASIGLASFPSDGATGEALIRNADIAMYRAKEQGRGRWVHYQEAMSRAAVEVLSLEKDLRAALQRSEIGVHFQPRVRLSDASLVGAEALARWRHSTRGAVSPSEFIGLAEEIGLIEELGESVLAQTCAFLSDWKRKGRPICPISVNLSALQLRNPDVSQRLSRIVARFHIEPSEIEFEITESALVNDMQGTRAALMRLRGAGFRISLDDFGTGYSSLSYLQNLPIDLMKIDRSFVKDLHSSPGSRAIATAIISMGHTLGLRVLAEGVETFEQANMLRQWGCEEAQGFLYARPLPAEQFSRYVLERLPEFAKSI